VTKFTGWVTEMFTFQLNVYTVAISSATKIVIIEWLRLNKTGFLMEYRDKLAEIVTMFTKQREHMDTEQ
jgi:hypothetical protein